MCAIFSEPVVVHYVIISLIDFILNIIVDSFTFVKLFKFIPRHIGYLTNVLPEVVNKIFILTVHCVITW